MQNEFNNDANSQEQLNIDRDPLFTMSVELGEEKTDTIPIYEDSTPEKLAYEFCKKHNLDFQTLNYLSNQIRNFRLENQQQQEAQQQQIIIEEDEENQTSGQRGDTHSRSESNNVFSNKDASTFNTFNLSGGINNTQGNAYAHIGLVSNGNINENEDGNENNEDDDKGVLNRAIEYEEDEESDNNDNQNDKHKEQQTTYQSQQQQQSQSNQTVLKPQTTQPIKYETFNNIFTSGICEPQLSLFSYNEFYNRFRQTIIDKQRTNNNNNLNINITNMNTINQPERDIYSHYNTNIHKTTRPSKKIQSPNHNNINDQNKSIISKRSFDSSKLIHRQHNTHLNIAKNEELLNNFFKNCNKLDDIYQNKINDASSYFKAIQTSQPNINNNNNHSANPNFDNSLINDNNTNIMSNNRISNGILHTNSYSPNYNNSNYKQLSKYIKPKSSKQTSNKCGERLYKQGIEMKERVSNKVNNIKQQLLSKNKDEYTYHPVVNHLSQNQLRKKMKEFFKSTKSNSKPKEKRTNNTNINSNNNNIMAYTNSNFYYNQAISELNSNRNWSNPPLKSTSSRNKSYDNKKYSYRKYYINNNTNYNNSNAFNYANSRNNNNISTNSNYAKRKKKIVNNQPVFPRKDDEYKVIDRDLVYKRKKEDVFRKIFNLLDQDKLNVLNMYNVDTNELPMNIYNIILPIINDIKYYKKEMKREEFIDEGMKLFNDISFNDKRALLNFETKI
jgi:hypothetical protein